ncbi:hypothetical protein L1887_13851 [Cichorium endivia]|nr:hypothetical protein L1887_13851 [Cichorium endivia]
MEYADIKPHTCHVTRIHYARIRASFHLYPWPTCKKTLLCLSHPPYFNRASISFQHQQHSFICFLSLIYIYTFIRLPIFITSSLSNLSLYFASSAFCSFDSWVSR